ncbi:MAG: hypothetical protein IJY74_00460 [Oscillospiraceae bacterium]|nr:hypothetical protein [Oscillospiraceae bacterium]
MNGINCGRELPPDTPECPYCAEKDAKKSENQKERRKIYITLLFCALALALIAAAVIIINPMDSFRREMNNAESSYAVAALCEESPSEAGDDRYQLILMDAADDIKERYNSLSCGYNQTANALKQLHCADNQVVRDKVLEVWADVERDRLFQLLNHKRTDNGVNELEWNENTALAAESVADEYEAVGMEYQNNMERLIKTLIPDTEKITVSSMFNAVNAQDALVKYESRSDSTKNTDLLYGSGISIAGADAVYDDETGTWSFFVLSQP